MVQKSTPIQPWGVIGAPPTMYFQKIQFLGVFCSFLQRSLLCYTFPDTYVEAWRQGIESKRSDIIVSIQDSQDQMIEKYIDFYEPFYQFGKPLRLIWQFSRNWILCIHRQIIQLLSCMRAHSNASARATIAQPGTT